MCVSWKGIFGYDWNDKTYEFDYDRLIDTPFTPMPICCVKHSPLAYTQTYIKPTKTQLAKQKDDEKKYRQKCKVFLHKFRNIRKEVVWKDS